MRLDIKSKIKKLKNDGTPTGYKRVKNYLIPDDWSLIRLGDIAIKIGSGKTPKGGERVYESDGIPFIRSQNVLNNKLDISNLAYINEETHSEMKSTKVLPCDILLNITGASIGRCCIVPDDFVEGNLNQHVCIIRTSKALVNEFLVNVIISEIGQNQIMMNQAGGNREGLNFQQIRNMIIPFPHVIEQQKIANILSTWDKAIELKEKLIETKKEQKRGLMKALLTGKKRLNGFNEKLKEVTLEDLFDRVTRKNTEENTNVLTISAQRGLISQSDFFNKIVASDILDNYSLLRKGEFAYNKSYSNGYPMGAIKRLNDYESGVVTTLYICFKLKEEYQEWSDYFEQYFESGLLNRGLTEVAQEGGRAHGLLNVSTKDFFDLKVLIPSEQEQFKISSILCCADKEISLLEKELESLKEQKKGLMQLLLTGIVRVKC